MGLLESLLAAIGQSQDDTPRQEASASQGYMETNKETVNLELPADPTCMLLDCVRELENLERAPENTQLWFPLGNGN